MMFRYHAGLEDDVDVSKVCSLLAGVPLALELAGKMMYINGDTVESLCAQLDEAGKRIQALKLGDECESLWATLMQSFSVLDEKERLVFFAFGALQAKAATLELLALTSRLSENSARQALVGLVRRSLTQPEVTKSGVERYRVHDLMHDFAYALCQIEDFSNAQMRAVEACASYCRRYAKDDATAHNFLDAEFENLQGAVNWAVQNECWETVNQVVMDLWANSLFLDWRGYPREASNLLTMGVQAARILGERRDETVHLRILGWTHRLLGEMDEAITCTQQALAVADAIDDAQGKHRALGNLGVFYNQLGRDDEAVLYSKQALAIAQQIGDRRWEGLHLLNLGVHYEAQGRLEDALQCYQQAMPIAKETRDQRGVCYNVLNIGHICAKLEQIDAATDYYNRALELADDAQSRGYVLGYLGEVYLKTGDLDQAEVFTWQALQVHRALGYRYGEAEWLHNLGDITISRTKIENDKLAVDRIQQSIALYEEAYLIRDAIKDTRASETLSAMMRAEALLSDLSAFG
jgi:tetratricopeptide (TPR) repeat protein